MILIVGSIILQQFEMQKTAEKRRRVPQEYPTINAAIAAADDGDTIQVESGNYSRIKIDKTLTIISSVSNYPSVDGVSLTADGVSFRGFTINDDFEISGNSNHIENNILLGGILNVSGSLNQISGNALNYTFANGGFDGVISGNFNNFANNTVFSWLGGVKFGGTGNKITDNQIMVAGAVRDGQIWGVNYGLNGWGPGCTISSNTIISEMDGIALISGNMTIPESGVTVINNTIISEAGVGIIVDSFLNYPEPSYNRISNNRISGLTAISVADSDGNIITDNVIIGRDSGISLETSENNLVAGNSIQWSSVGILIGRWSDNNTLMGNTITNCATGLIERNYRSQNLIYLNNFVENKVNAYDNGLAVWYKNGKGNYWSNWVGPDDNMDGIVDKPYFLDGGAGSLDMYPSVNPIIWSHGASEVIRA